MCLDEFELEIVCFTFRGVWNMGVVVALRVRMFKIGHNEYYIQNNLINPIVYNNKSIFYHFHVESFPQLLIN